MSGFYILLESLTACLAVGFTPGQVPRQTRLRVNLHAPSLWPHHKYNRGAWNILLVFVFFKIHNDVSGKSDWEETVP